MSVGPVLRKRRAGRSEESLEESLLHHRADAWLRAEGSGYTEDSRVRRRDVETRDAYRFVRSGRELARDAF
jgi:hypothetical protein